MNIVLKEVPEGEYIVEIVEMKSLIDRKNRKVVTWLLRIVNGPFAESFLEKKYYLVNKNVAAFLKKELVMIGIQAR